MKKILAINILLIFSILFSGCTIKGNPNLWAARLADQMNTKIPHTIFSEHSHLKCNI